LPANNGGFSTSQTVTSGQQPNCSSYSAVTGGFIFGIHQYPAEALAAWSNFSHAPITMAAAFPIEKKGGFSEKISQRVSLEKETSIVSKENPWFFLQNFQTIH